jgi:molybdopterin-guanine dinucleotide biosynthesis protein A
MATSIAPQHAQPGAVPPAVAIILAGGQASRMGGGDKALRPLAGQPLLGHVLARLAPQVAPVALSANGDPARFAAWGLPVLADTVPGFPGPLAGVLAGLRWAAGQGAADALVVPTDTPFLPPDLLARLAAGRGTAAIACAASAGRAHPVIALWPTSLADPLEAALLAGERRMHDVMGRLGLAEIAFPPCPEGDPFANLNTPDDLAEAESRLRAQRPGGSVCRNA